MPPVTLSADDAAALVRPVDTIGLGLGPANPHAFLRALSAREDFVDLTVGGALLLGLFDVVTRPGVHYRCGFYGPVERLYKQQGADVQLVPAGFRQFAPVLERFAPRIMAVQATPPDRDGRCSLSLHFGATRDALLAAGRDPDRVLVVECNGALPRTTALEGFDNTVALELADVVIESDEPLVALPAPERTDADAQIAELALGYVSDGTTLQTGIGAIPSIVAARLADRDGGDYGVHSEMFTDGLMALHEAGKVTNAKKGQFDGVSVTTFALGSLALYAWLDENPDVAFGPVSVVNDPSVIRRNRRFVSVNGAIQVDLYGQVVADAVGGRQISGVGGHEDFVAGADLDTEDRSLVCLRSTATVGGTRRSRIVAALEAGSVVATPRHHTGTVITEFGAADLAGRTVRERALALAAIAHPEYRDELVEAAGRLDA
ncbi:MAG TPA: acetyl-CoA hydrolase/transferase C-terminal domain-containing protein [Acidimicrobiales bacterium]|nr:acetyl-CoA hydrolase/transferase C-terminal domain-containing protein [Acidimicrobiales bacterium]